MDGEDSIRFVGPDGDVGLAAVIYGDRLSSAALPICGQTPADYVAINAYGQACMEGHVHVFVFVVEGYEGLVTSAESHLVEAVVPPVVHARLWNRVPHYHNEPVKKLTYLTYNSPKSLE